MNSDLDSLVGFSVSLFSVRFCMEGTLVKTFIDDVYRLDMVRGYYTFNKKEVKYVDAKKFRVSIEATL